MSVLGIDGALGGFSAAAARGGKLLASRARSGNCALEAGLGLIAEVLEAAVLAPADLARIAVGIGPGGFTGLRIAIAYAKSLAQAWELPLVALSSFDLLESGRSLERVLTVVVGRPGVISARYRDGGRARRASGRVADVLAEILPAGDAESLPVVGAPEDVLGALAERGTTVIVLPPLIVPAAAAAALAAPALVPARSPHAVRADYGELPAAKVPKA